MNTQEDPATLAEYGMASGPSSSKITSKALTVLVIGA